MALAGTKLTLSDAERARRAERMKIVRELRPMLTPEQHKRRILKMAQTRYGKIYSDIRTPEERKLAQAEAARRYNEMHKDVLRMKSRNRRQANLERVRASDRSFAEKRRKRDPYAYAAWQFGISREDIAAMYERQHHLCAICGRPERTIVRGKPRRLAIDHSHETNAIRELLCSACNQMLGAIEEQPAVLRTAANYLERHNGTESYDFDGHA